jgi:hypothetical protein
LEPKSRGLPTGQRRAAIEGTTATMDKAEFLKNVYRTMPREIPSAWMADAWVIDEVRAELTYGLARAVSKCGSLSFTKDYLDLLARSLSDGQLVQLYCDIRDQSGRHEEEWREDFERAFPKIVGLLPDPRAFPEIDAFLNGQELRVAWARAAWEDDRAREFITSHMAQDLKHGGESWCRREWLEHLDLCLSRNQLVRLYAELRDRSGRPEREWRHVFEEAFPDCLDHFPKPLDQSGDA